MSKSEKQFDSWFDMFKATTQRFEDENDDLEAILEGDVGFHAYFVADGGDDTRGCHTAVYQGLYETLNEISVDAEIVESRYGEVTPKTVWKEMESQIDEYAYLPSEVREPIEKRVKERVRKNQKNSLPDGQETL